MAKLTAEAVWDLKEKELLDLIDTKAFTTQSRNIRFYAPSFTYYKTQSYCGGNSEFPSVSVTGNACTLNCKHCGGKILETMHTAMTPKTLFEKCKTLKEGGAKGVLVSGGCLPDGSVPLEKFCGTLESIKHKLGLTIFVHTGIVSEEKAKQLKSASIDAALIDVIGSDETIQEVFNLQTKTCQYDNSLQALNNAGIDFIPHVITGLHHGMLKGELEALKIIKRHKPNAIVIISFMPIQGTAMQNTKPPTPTDITRTVAAARVMFPQIPLVLGCMRPKGKHRAETDVLAIKAGVDGIAFPAEEAIQYAKKRGCIVTFSEFCCAQIYKDLAADSLEDSSSMT